MLCLEPERDNGTRPLHADERDDGDSRRGGWLMVVDHLAASNEGIDAHADVKVTKQSPARLCGIGHG